MQLSYVIISYNEREYLAQAIESCLQQNMESSEIMIADDGSTDGSIELIQSYANQYPDKILYFVNDRSDAVPGKVIAPIRVSNNIKQALSMARGKYCQLLSGDDFLYPGGFSQDAVNFLEEHPNHSAYVGAYEKVWEDRPAVICRAFYPKRLYWSGDYLHLSAFVFRKELFDCGGFLQRFCDDTGLHYSMAISGKWKYTDDVVMAYRQRSGSIMHEADSLELSVMDLMLLQDVLQVGKLYFQTMARFVRALWNTFRNRSCLREQRYSKYLENCAQYPHDILGAIVNYDTLPWVQKGKLLLQLAVSGVMHLLVEFILLFKRAERKIRIVFTKK